jgi:hypothetical protein
MSVQMFLIGLVADLVATNRRLSEEVLLRVKKLELREPRETKKGEAAAAAPRE